MSPRRIASLRDALADQIEGAAVARPPDLRPAILGVHRADPRGKARRADQHAVADMHRSGQHRPGDHDPDAGQRERPIDRQTKAAYRRRGRPCWRRPR